MTAPSLDWLAAIAATVLDRPHNEPLALSDTEFERLQVVTELVQQESTVVDRAACLLWAIVHLNPLPTKNHQFAVLAADMHLSANGLALTTDQPDLFHKLIDGIASGALDRTEATSWVRDHISMTEREDRMFERFTDRARRSLVLATQEAESLGHNFIGTEHLLLGLMAEGTGVASRALTELGITPETTRQKIIETLGPVRGP
jgi:prophage maintenance system killer protein